MSLSETPYFYSQFLQNKPAVLLSKAQSPKFSRVMHTQKKFAMKKYYLLFLSILSFSLLEASTPFFNEINYWGFGPNKGLEVAGPAGTDLTGWKVQTYDASGNVRSTKAFPAGSIIPNQQGYRGTIWMEVSQFDSGGGSAALIRPDNEVAQYLSFGHNPLSALEGLAAGLNPDHIGSQLLPDNSLQLAGTGLGYNDFAWLLPLGRTPALINTNQIFGLLRGILGILFIDEQLGDQADGEMALWPNPATSLVNINTPATIPGEMLEIRVVNSSGQVVLQQTCTGAQCVQANISNWQSGLYIVQLYHQGALLQTQRLLKQ